MLYIYDARYNLKTPTTWDKLEGITGSKKNTLMSLKSRKSKLPRLDYCYLIDENTIKQQLREWYEKVKFENEIWKDMDDTYKISNYGRVKKIYKKYPEGKLMMPFPKQTYKGKLAIKIYGKEVLVHKLVARLFVENPNKYPCVYHKNGILHDNYHCNLGWVSRVEVGKIGSRRRNHHDGKSIIAIDSYTNEIIDYYPTARLAAKELFTNRQSVMDCINGKIEATRTGYIFKYEEEVV